nr:hypothetical protein [Herbidospora sakaeratensis]
MLFETELAFEGVVDGLDQLPDRLEQQFSWTWCAAVAVGRAQQADTPGGQEPVEFGGDVALAGQDQQSGPGGEQVGFQVADGHQHLAFVDLRVGQGPGDRRSGRGADQMEFQAPVEA